MNQNLPQPRSAWYKPKRLGLSVFIIAMLITQLIAFKIYTVEKANELQEARNEAEHIKNQLENSLDFSITATRVLAFMEEQDLMGDNFDSISHDLIQRNKFIDALELVKGSHIIKIYPLEGNEAALGLDILKDSVHRKEALKALARRELYFEGPFSLTQGGRGIVGRFPIYKKGDFWGFSVVLIRLETLLNAIQVTEQANKSKFTYQFIKVNGENLKSNAFFPDLENYDSGIYYKEFIPLGDWEVYVKITEPEHLIKTLPFSLLGILFAVALAFLAYHLAALPQKLSLMVDEKTKDLAKLNELLEERAKELTASNQELQQFAQIASHDLQEPLRMVTSFLSQLERKYSHALDEKGLLYIGFAVDGAKRMRQIILDVLEFSKVGKYEYPIEPIPLERAIDETKLLLKKLIEETSTQILYQDLPTIYTYHTPLNQILQNLIANAIRYRKIDVEPIIEITAEDKGDSWQIAVKDNGMGIEEEYQQKIFQLFQRLNQSDQYKGSGMGLSIAKKTAESLGGTIWVESEVQKGSTFVFTIKKVNPN